MRINLMKIDFGGRELLNISIEKTTSCNSGLNNHWADIILRSMWSKGTKGKRLLCFAPLKSSMVMRLKNRQVHIHFAVEFELSKGACELGVHLFVMQDDDRKELN